MKRYLVSFANTANAVKRRVLKSLLFALVGVAILTLPQVALAMAPW